MDPYMMYPPHIPTPTLPKPKMPAFLTAAQAAVEPTRAVGLWPAGVRPTAPTPPPVVTPSGVPGPGAHTPPATGALLAPTEPAVVYEFTPPPDTETRAPLGVLIRQALSAMDRDMMSAEEIRAYNDALQAAGGPLPLKVPRTPMTQAQLAEANATDEAIRAYRWERQGGVGLIPPGSTTMAVDLGWSWPSSRVPQNAQQAAEKAAYDDAQARTTAALPGATDDDINALLAQLEAALKSPDYLDTQKAEIQGMLDAIQHWRLVRGFAPRPIQVQPPTTPSTVEEPQPFTPPAGKFWHTLIWDDTTVLADEGQRIKQFILGLVKKYPINSVLAQMLTGQLLMLRDYANNVWNAHKQGDFIKAGDLRDDAIANSDPALADVLREIEQWAEQAEPRTTARKGFAGRPTRR